MWFFDDDPKVLYWRQYSIAANGMQVEFRLEAKSETGRLFWQGQILFSHHRDYGEHRGNTKFLCAPFGKVDIAKL